MTPWKWILHSEWVCVLGGGGCHSDFMFKKERKSQQQIEEGTLNKNFAFDLGGVGVGWEGKGEL